MKIKSFVQFVSETVQPRVDSWLDLPKSQRGQFTESPKVDPNDIKNIKISK